MSGGFAIDDILNANDSDEDIDTKSVDLEMLLDDNDSDDDEDAVGVGVDAAAAVGMSKSQGVHLKSTKNYYSSSSTSATSTSTKQTVDKILEEDNDAGDQNKMEELLLALGGGANNFSESQVSNDDTFQSTNFDLPLQDLRIEKDRDQTNPLSLLSTLELAERREQRLMKSGDRDGVSALQAKLTLPKSDSETQSLFQLKCSSLETISSQLSRNAQFRQHGPGTATVVQISTKFIAVGTTRGLVLLFDHAQEMRQVIGSSIAANSRNSTPVTALDVAVSSDSLFCGHENGELIIWDTAKGTILKRISDLHSVRIVKFSVVYGVGENTSQQANGISNDYSLVSVDRKGVVMKSKLSKVLFLAVSVESECLLDGTAGVVLDMSPLAPYTTTIPFRTGDSPPPCAIRASEQLIALNSETRTYIIRVYPEVFVLNRWAAPQEIADGKSGVIRPGFVVSLDWSWGSSHDYPVLKSRSLSGRNGLNYLCPLLIRGWGRTVQLYACCVPPITQQSSQKESMINSEAPCDFISLGETVFEESTLVLSVRWLGMNSIVALTNQDVYVIRTLEFTTDRIPLISPLATLLNFSLERKGLDDPFDVSIAVAKQRMYLLSPEKMFVFYVQSWREQIDQLVVDGQWLDALTLVLDRYIKSGGKNKRIEDLTRTNYSHSLADEVTSADMEVYIRRYADMAVVRQQGISQLNRKSMIGASGVPSGSSGPGGATSGHSTGQQHHYFLVAAVCIEFCILAGGQLINVLFEEIYHTFTSAHQQTIFLESLEPFILRRQIRNLPPVVYLDFLDYGIRSRKFAFLERCISFLDLVDIDMNATVRILLKQELISGFLYVYSYGLLDYAGAFQLIYEHMIMKQSTNSSIAVEFPSPEQTDIGYKLLLFIQYTSQNRVFPRGEVLKLSSNSLISLARLLLSPAILPPITGSARLEMQLEKHPLFLKTFPYLYALAKIDYYALFYCLHLCLIKIYDSHGHHITTPTAATTVTTTSQSSHDLGELPYGDLLYSALLFAKFGDNDLGMKNSFQRCFYEHLLDHIVIVTSSLPEPFLRDIIFHCKSHIKPHSAAEKYLFTLVASQSKNLNSFPNFAATLETNGFYFPALRLYGGKFKPTNETLGKALQSYLADRNEEQRLKVFDYIQEFFSKLNHVESSIAGETSDNRLVKCRLVVISHLEELASINLLLTKRIVIAYLNQHITEIIEKTQKHQRLQFELLDSLVRGIPVSAETTRASPSTASGATSPQHQQLQQQDETVVNDSVESIGLLDDLFTPQQILAYISQLATFCPHDLYSFLTTHHNYPLDDVLKLCRNKNIFDSTAFLLERAGDFQAALDLSLTEIGLSIHQIVSGIAHLLDDQSLDQESKKISSSNRRGSRSGGLQGATTSSEDVLSILKSAGNQHVSTGGHAYGLSSPVLEPVNKLQGFKSFSLAISTATGLCTRHDSKSNTTNWFKVLDFLLKEKHALVSTPRSNNVKSKEEIASDITAIIVGYALKDFMGQMSSHVPSQDIVRRITQEQILGSRFAEFKDVMISMVESYAYEVTLYKTYLRINTEDILQLRAQRMKQKHKAVRHSGNLQSLLDATPEDNSNGGVVGDVALVPHSGGIHLIRDDDDLLHQEKDSFNEGRKSTASSSHKMKGKSSKNLMMRFKVIHDSKAKGYIDTVVPPIVSENFGSLPRRVPGSLPQVPKFQAVYGY